MTKIPFFILVNIFADNSVIEHIYVPQIYQGKILVSCSCPNISDPWHGAGPVAHTSQNQEKWAAI